MSDEFDKEAEREKLREKYGDDAEDRQATERMSDLLLKGATMTNTHCGTCGDPLFRQNGVTFCPSCHGGPEGVEGTGVEEAENQAGGKLQGQGAPTGPGNAGGATEIDVSSPGEGEEGRAAEPGGQSGGSEPAPPGADERATPPHGNRPETSPSDPGQRADRGGPRATPSRDASPPDRSGASRAPTEPAADRTPAGGSEADARESLIAALERFSAEAAATDDPRYAKECLAAAREASEALAALR
ncbi:Sjogren's syndrome/scleroderma autoantigen 1 family protein [Saliphagus sp. LR7]|uniref:Sjogren's syndrome/scleroderma autoantigen 1 family protein n=1 Tax=Saliphagus sp. LR7 TaxID=2282654 RepID=UPI000DF80E33|nr:Sjogren's syndrome/scleroderma autoantigen 1 family protein [Saliphagus sp. LR7]